MGAISIGGVLSVCAAQLEVRAVLSDSGSSYAAAATSVLAPIDGISCVDVRVWLRACGCARARGMQSGMDDDDRQLRTDRLVLRRWRDSDRDPFAALNADPEVMEHFPSTLDRAESDAMIDRIDAHIAGSGWGLWAVERACDGAFLGFTGLAVPRFNSHFTPAVEVGWRLARHAWGHGYATEAAHAALDYAFNELALAEVVSFTVPTNVRSRAVMERIGMSRDPAGDFDHPNIPPASPLRRHVLYRFRRG